MNRLICGLILIALATCVTYGCNKKDDTESTLQFEEIYESLIDEAGQLPDMEVTDSNDDVQGETFEYLFDFDYDDVERYSFTYSSEGKPQELALIKLRDGADADELKECIKYYIEGRVDRYSTYSPEDVEVMQGALIASKNEYVMYVSGGNTSKVKAAFDKFFQ